MVQTLFQAVMNTGISGSVIKINDRCLVKTILVPFLYYTCFYVHNMISIGAATSFAFLERKEVQENNINTNRLQTCALEIYSGQYHYNQVCRFHNACIRDSGKLVIHQNWKAEEGLLQSQCKDLDFEYMNESIHRASILESSNLDLVQSLRKLALIDTNITNQPYLIQHYIQIYFILRLLQTPWQFLKLHQFICPSNDSCSKHKLQSQVPVNTGLIVPNKMTLFEQASWIPSFLKLMPGNPVLVPEEHLHSGLNCYNSVITYSFKISND